MPSRLLQQIFKQVEELRRHSRTPVVLQGYRYIEALAASLAHYAAKDALFSAILKRAVLRLPETAYPSATSDMRASEILMDHADLFYLLEPRNTTVALERAGWLIGRIMEDRLSGTRAASRVLTAWAHMYEPAGAIGAESGPSMIIVGVVAVVVRGIPQKGSLRNLAMPVIIRSDFLAASSSLALIRAASRSMLGIVSRVFSTGGGFKNVEPDLASWFTGEQNAAFYAASGRSMTLLAQELRLLDIPHAAVCSGGAVPSVLAVSPSVNLANLEARGRLELIDFESV